MAYNLRPPSIEVKIAYVPTKEKTTLSIAVFFYRLMSFLFKIVCFIVYWQMTESHRNVKILITIVFTFAYFALLFFIFL